MPNMNLGGRKSSDLSAFSDAVINGPATKMVKLTKGSAIAGGPPKALWVGTPGTINAKDLEGNTCTAFPVFAGRNSIVVSELLAGGTADDIWALY